MIAARLDHRPQPDALLVVGDVLDLVGARAAVDLAQLRQDVGERLARDVDPEDVGRDQSLQLRRQLGLAPLRVERRVADRLAAERVEPRGEVAVSAMGRDQRHRGRDGLRRAACPAPAPRPGAPRGRRRARWEAAEAEALRPRRGRCRPPAAARPAARARDGSRRARSPRSRTARAIRPGHRPGSRGTARAARSRSPRSVRRRHALSSSLLYQPGSLPGRPRLSRAGGWSTRRAPCRRRSRPLRPRSRARRAGGAGPRSPRRSARASSATGISLAGR